MATKKVEVVLEQPEICIKSTEVIKCKSHMEGHADHYMIEIKYTNGDTQVMTSKNTQPNHFGTHEFETNDELFEFAKKLNSN